MSTEKFDCNLKKNLDEICVDPNEPTQNYTIVPNALIRDSSISPNCRWLLTFLLSNKPGWVIRINQIWGHTEGFLGRDVIYRLIKEAIKAGYIQRNEICEKTARGTLKRYSYIISSTPKFKKVLRCPEIQDTDHPLPDLPFPENQYTEDQDAKELLSKELLSKETTPSISPSFSESAIASEVSAEKTSDERKSSEIPEEVKLLASKMLGLLEKHNPDYRPPKNLLAFLKKVQLLMKDEHTAERILQVLDWALQDNVESDNFKGWSSVIYSKNPAETLRKHFAKIARQMTARPKRKFAPCSDDDASLAKMQEWSKSAI